MDSLTVYTTKPFGTAYRGFGHVELFWAIESQMDMVARELKMDPYEFRMKNLLKPGATTITGEEVTEHTGSVRKCLEEVAKEIGWGKPGEDPSGDSGNAGDESERPGDESGTPGDESGRPAGGKVRAKGIAVLHKAPAMPPNTASSAIMKFNEDATVDLLVSGVDYGQGTATSLSQIAAHELKMPLDRIHFIWNKDTDFSPYDWQTVASRFTVMGGLSIIKAAADATGQIKEVAAEALEVKPEDLEVKAGVVFVKKDPSRALDYTEIVMGYKFPNGNSIGGPVIGRGNYIAEGLTNLDLETGQGLPALNWTYGAHGVEIEIDTRTGDIEILKLASAFDVGKIINEGLCIGQVVGGGIQGVGTALHEQYIYDKAGRLLNPTLTDYKIPTVKDIPQVIKPIFVETPHDKGPFGARGVAEHPMISVPPAIANAIFNGTGVRIKELPLSPERVFLALNSGPSKR
jgi:CO/xanthine dehydrogenase Mo-binding subunit